MVPLTFSLIMLVTHIFFANINKVFLGATPAHFDNEQNDPFKEYTCDTDPSLIHSSKSLLGSGCAWVPSSRTPRRPSGPALTGRPLPSLARGE